VIALIVSLSICFVLLIFMWVAIAREPGPSAADVAIAYERAWDALDFSLLFDLSGDELRDGLRREDFIAAKRAAYAGKNGRLGAKVVVDTSVVGHQTALVVTRVEAAGGSVRNNVMLEHTSNGWKVVGYSLRPDSETDAPTNA
jgi:hypothetical protein